MVAFLHESLFTCAEITHVTLERAHIRFLLDDGEIYIVASTFTWSAVPICAIARADERAVGLMSLQNTLSHSQETGFDECCTVRNIIAKSQCPIIKDSKGKLMRVTSEERFCYHV